MSPRIAIIGAGPGGLALACILRKGSIIPSVFERDPSSNYRSQGGTLDLDVHSGQQALHDAGLWDQFLKYARYDAQIMKFLTKNGDIIHQIGPDTGEDTRPEIDRTALRNIFLDSFGTENINWGHELVSVEKNQDSRYDLYFKNNKLKSGFDLVVGADGAHSRVRPRITSVAPFYSGVSIIEFDIHCAPIRSGSPEGLTTERDSSDDRYRTKVRDKNSVTYLVHCLVVFRTDDPHPPACSVVSPGTNGGSFVLSRTYLPHSKPVPHLRLGT